MSGILGYRVLRKCRERLRYQQRSSMQNIIQKTPLLFKVRQGINDLATRILGANFVIQGAIPKILKETPKDWFDENMRYIEVGNSCLTYSYYGGHRKERLDCEIFKTSIYFNSGWFSRLKNAFSSTRIYFSQLLTQLAHDVVLTFIWRRFNVMGVVKTLKTLGRRRMPWTLKWRCVRAGMHWFCAIKYPLRITRYVPFYCVFRTQYCFNVYTTSTTLDDVLWTLIWSLAP